MAKKNPEYTYSVNGEGFNSFMEARRRAESLDANVVQNDNGMVRWHPAPKKSGARTKHVLLDSKGNETAWPSRRRKKNPADGAAEVYEEFHGVPSEEILEYVTKFHIHENLGGLGRLVELVFFTGGAKSVKVTMTEEDLGRTMWLAGSEDRKQLYILGEITVDLEELGYRPDVDVKDANALGYLTNVVYETRKTMNQLKLIEYDHQIGKRERWQKREGVGPEMNKRVGDAPILAYYPREERLAVVGGQYLILPEGISN